MKGSYQTKFKRKRSLTHNFLVIGQLISYDTLKIPRSSWYHGKKLTSHNETCEENVRRDTIETKDQNLSKRKNVRTWGKKAIKTEYDEEDKKVKNWEV